MPARPLHTTSLSNGLRIVIVPDPRALTVTALVLVGTGSASERPTENGLSHFLEHVCFKGTVRRPTTRDIVHEIESLGAITNAFTDRELTGYYIKGDPRHLSTFTDILADIYQHSTFPEAEIKKERGVIIEEINMYEDQPAHKVGDVFYDLLYKGQAIGKSILGTKESVSSFTQKDFLSYKQRFYTGANTVVVLAGNVAPAKGTALVKRFFGSVPSGKRNVRTRTNQSQKGASVAIHFKQTDQAHFLLGFRSMPLGHRDLPAITILSTILGRGMSSRLSMLIREELGAAYYVGTFQDLFIKSGVFIISAGVDKTRLSEILERVAEECRRLKEESVEGVELSKAKEYALGTFRLGLELSDDLATFYGSQLVLQQRLRTPEQAMAQLKAVTAADVRRVARALFKKERATLAVVGAFEQGAVKPQLFSKL